MYKHYNNTNPLFKEITNPIEGLEKINTLLTFLAELDRSGFKIESSFTAKEAISLLLEIVTETTEQIEFSLRNSNQKII